MHDDRQGEQVFLPVNRKIPSVLAGSDGDISRPFLPMSFSRHHPLDVLDWANIANGQLSRRDFGLIFLRHIHSCLFVHFLCC